MRARRRESPHNKIESGTCNYEERYYARVVEIANVTRVVTVELWQLQIRVGFTSAIAAFGEGSTSSNVAFANSKRV